MAESGLHQKNLLFLDRLLPERIQRSQPVEAFKQLEPLDQNRQADRQIRSVSGGLLSSRSCGLRGPIGPLGFAIRVVRVQIPDRRQAAPRLAQNLQMRHVVSQLFFTDRNEPLKLQAGERIGVFDDVPVEIQGIPAT